ncbi:transmembrane protein, putative [Medicago truncatula]|uniref:Transmembrane protein, putative n=1 Tax=Medicago truncatula TaxID=3880 RepID=A0A072UJI3_MEDTR|nr:transmembrane protein, putative [Medicago truncatula]
MTKFSILKTFKVDIHPPRAPLIKEVIWFPLIPPWIKCNIDGSSINNFYVASARAVFRNSGVCIVLLNILALVIYVKCFNNLWLETYSKLVLLAFANTALVPWPIKNRWLNCLALTNKMNFMVTRRHDNKTHTYGYLPEPNPI